MKHTGSRLRYASLVMGIALTPWCALTAQQDTATTVVESLLRESRLALDNLAYGRADSIAQVAFRLPNLSRVQKIRSLQLSAAARYPDSPTEQRPDSAMVALRSLIKFAPSAAPPAAISWRGLDSLFAVARQTTFGIGVLPRDSVLIEGFLGAVPIDVQTTRPARFRLLLAPADGPGAPVPVDSAGLGIAATLRFQPVLDEQPRFPTGRYVATVEATNDETGERLTVRVVVDLTTPPLPLHRVPMTWDRAGVKPTRTKPARASSVLSGLAVGAFTAFAVRAQRPTELANGPSQDGRARSWGIGLGLATAIGSWLLDVGRDIPENIKFNADLQREWAATQTRLLDENRAWQAAYRGSAKMRLEDR